MEGKRRGGVNCGEWEEERVYEARGGKCGGGKEERGEAWRVGRGEVV